MATKSDKKTICLNMIVKNESAIIERCLDSLINQIDYWVIIDTGSTDNTQQIIKDYMQKHNILGELVERPWVNFSHNRSEALELAEDKADYILLCDADMVLEVIDPKWKSELKGDPSYLVVQKNNTLRYHNIRLVNGRLKGRERFRYWGATHEYCDSIDGNNSSAFIRGIEFADYQDGGAKNDKFVRDIRLLTEEINRLKALENATEEEKNNAMEVGLWHRREGLIQRCTFYLAQTWRDLEENQQALETYKQRVALGGWVEEIYYSLLQIALLKIKLNNSLDDIHQAFLEAYEYRPQRAESLYFLARHLRLNNRIKLAYIYALTAVNIPKNEDRLFINYEAYGWQAKDELAVAAYWVENYQLCYDLCLELLDNPSIPERDKQRFKENLKFAEEKLALKQ
ncbi:glycosyltransferase [Pelistega ratti]|uniref:glycosyltransferase n=1 Tax=Pelistega ratti TaxID=2652177 RepID=UPI0013569D2F|nr:glycosyltransferase [Pelistega ratti]